MDPAMTTKCIAVRVATALGLTAAFAVVTLLASPRPRGRA
jgi:hypothetical protein